MKKIAIIMALCLALTALAGCGAADSAVESAPASSAASSEAASSEAVSSEAASEAVSSEAAEASGLEAMMDTVLSGFGEGELPDQPTPDMLDGHKYRVIGEEEAEFYTGVTHDAFVEGIVSEPMIGSIAHKVVLMSAESPEAAAQLAADVEANADPRWLVCVEAEKTVVSTVDNVVLLVMSDAATADKIAANFDALAQ